MRKQISIDDKHNTPSYIIPEWIKKYEDIMAPIRIDSIRITKLSNQWTLFFYGVGETIGGLVLNKTTPEELGELFDYATYKKIPIILK